MHKSDRLFQLTNILRVHKVITAKELALKLDVSERTIYRYIDDLSVSGIPIYGEAGKGYTLSDDFELPPIKLNKKEIEALVLGVNLVSSWTGKTMKNAAKSLLNKIDAVIPKQIENEKPIRYARVPSGHRRDDSLRWEQIHTALNEKKWIRIKYESLNSSSTTRIIFPLGMFYWGGKWTLGSWCSLRNDFRDFRNDRMLSIEIIDFDSILPSTVTLEKYISLQENKEKQYATDTMLSVEILDNP
jgi:predicted DNA-binding transcriptional regulator YafY